MTSSLAVSSSLGRHAARMATFAAALLALTSGAPAASLVDVSTGPLYGGRQAHPNVVVATSVEFPTVGAAYNGVRYVPTAAYVGYFDANKCYSYDTGGNFFYPNGNASNDGRHECDRGGANQGFSGNFMNWATMSAIDEFRYAMTGGNRVDENGQNGGVLVERAYLPDGSVGGVPSFYAASSNFPRHTLSGNGNIDGYAASKARDVLPNNILGGAGNSTPLYFTNCKSSVFFGTSGGGSCGAPDASVGSFRVRVLVCDSTEGPARTDLCMQYGENGPYKPVGQAQRNADRMRFASFGYLMDHNVTGYTAPCSESGWNRCRYGGVLRSPMKYVGPTTYNANQVASANARAEINTDGTLVADPEGNAASAGGAYSGFINYINKFGSGGVYKRLDPAGEMYYEALRYLEGLQPTPDADSGTINNGIKDFFPYTPSPWRDPIQTACSQNYIINLSDANTWDDTYLPGYNGTPTPGYHRPTSRPVDERGLDAHDWTARIGFLESNTSSLVSNDVRPGLSNIANINTANNASYLLAGAAFWANSVDIRPDLIGKQTVKTISFDVAEPANTIQDRQLYLLGKYGGFNNTIDRTSDTYPNPFWGTNPSDVNGPAIRTNREWEDSPGSGYPQSYLLASNPQKLIDGLRAAFQRIATTTGNLSGAALTSANLTYGSAGAYIATFTPTWAGSVQLKSISVDNNTGNLAVSDTPIWDAGQVLDARCGSITTPTTTCNEVDASANKRNILTTVSIAGTRSAQPFRSQDLVDDLAYVAALNKDPATGVSDGLGVQRLNYLRGDRQYESGPTPFRIRDSVLGDIINSGPVYVGPPSSSIPGSDYQTFFTTHASRTPAVYAGANDGMLHAFRASDGVELFAYVPRFLAQDLNVLTDPGYTHIPFVDTVPRVQEAKVGSTWKTILLGAGGAGEQGVFALDVTNPSSFGTSNVLFEFTDADDPDLGNVIATPEFAKLWVSGPATAKVYQYFAVVTSYNNRRTTFNGHSDGQVSTDSQNEGVLFLLALDHTLGTAWTQGTDYYKFKFPATTPTAANGLAPVSLLASTTGDRSTAAMYFGDLQGNLWKLNTYTGDPSTWASALGTQSSPLPLFVAQDGNGNRQPITARPELSSGPFGSTLVFFGTGQYLGQTDLTLPGSVQTEYALIDVNPTVAVTRSSDLVQRTAAVSGSTVTVTGAAFTYSGATSKKGWYLDFPSSASSGERSVTKPAVRNGLLTFTTLTLASDVCGSGSGYIYQVNALTGLPFGGGSVIGYTSTVGVPGPPRIVDLTIAAGTGRRTGEQIDLRRSAAVVSGTLPTIAQPGNAVTSKAPPVGRVTWREITNWADLTGQ